MNVRMRHSYVTDDTGDCSLKELDYVETLRQSTDIDGAIVPAGSKGTIVAIWANGSFEVEFQLPQTLVALQGSDLRKIDESSV